MTIAPDLLLDSVNVRRLVFLRGLGVFKWHIALVTPKLVVLYVSMYYYDTPSPACVS